MRRLAIIIASAIMIASCGHDGTAERLTFKRGRLDAVIAAAAYAAHCGGVLIIDADDGEPLVASCDR